MSTVSVGFSPVTPGNSVITGGVAATAAAASGEGESPLGLFAALLDTMAQGLGVTPPAGTTTKPDTATGQTFIGDTAAPALANIAAAAASAAATRADPASTELATDAGLLFSSLVSSLTAIDDAAKSGKPIDPALSKKLNDTLDELAGMLGIVLPTAPAVDPAITAAATTGSVTPVETTLDPLIEIAKAAIPAATAPQDATPDVELLEGLADEFLKAVDKASGPAPIEPRQPVEANKTQTAAPTTVAAAPAVEAAPIDPASPLGQLIGKIKNIAENLQAAAPELGAKLAAVVEKLAAQPIDAKTLAKLNTDLDGPELTALLTPKPETKPASSGTQVFTAPSLPVPDVVTQPVKTAEPKVAEASPVAASRTDDAPDTTPAAAKPEASTAPVTKPDVEPKAVDRTGAGQANDVRADRAADHAQNQTNQIAAAAQARSEVGPVVAKAALTGYQAPAQQQVNVPHLAFEFVRQFNQGSSRFQIRLDPAELGRIDVKMHMDGDGNMLARMTVERAETLDLMQRDQRSLEKALAQAGLDSSKTTLEFSLRQNPSGREGQNPQQQQGGNGSPFAQARSGTDEVQEIIPNATLYRGTASASGVNLFV